MPATILLPRPAPAPDLPPLPAYDDAPETPAERRTRQAQQLRRLTALNMQAAEVAAAQIVARAPVTRESPSPTIGLARATRAVTEIIELEHRLFDAEPRAAQRKPAPARQPGNPSDPRRPLLRTALYKSLDAEPDRAARNQLRRMIDEQIEEQLDADPERASQVTEILFAIGQELGLTIDPKKLSDEILGLKPPPRPALDPLGTRSALWAPPYVPGTEPPEIP